MRLQSKPRQNPVVPSDGHICPHHRPGLSAVEADAAAYVVSRAAEAPGSIDIAVLDVFDGTDSTPPSTSSPGAYVPLDQFTFRSCTGIERPDRSASALAVLDVFDGVMLRRERCPPRCLSCKITLPWWTAGMLLFERRKAARAHGNRCCAHNSLVATTRAGWPVLPQVSTFLPDLS